MAGSVTRKKLGRKSFSASGTWQRKFLDGRVINEEPRHINRLLVDPEQIQYVPYSIDGWREKLKRRNGVTTIAIGIATSEGSRRFKREVVTVPYRSESIGYNDLEKSYTLISQYGHLLSAYGSIPSGYPSLPLAQALSSERFIASMLDATHKIRGASVLAEARQAVQGLASPAKALRKEVDNLYKSVKGLMYRNRGNSVRSMRDAVAGTWLEWNFGLKPTIQDANDAADALNQLRTREHVAVFPIKGYGEDSVFVPGLRNIPVAGPFEPIGLVSWHQQDRSQCITRGCLKVPASPSSDVPLAQQFGVGWRDVPSALWEGMAWSWLYDYFFNVSSVIDAWMAPMCSVAWANRTIRNSRTYVYEDIQPRKDTQSGKSYVRYKASGGRCQLSATQITRTPVDPQTVRPPLRIKLPGFGTKWANLGAIASYGLTWKKETRIWKRLPKIRRRNAIWHR
jgi:hypothetical protein